jgi:hypothetical protein
MDSRERFLCTINGGEPDRSPFYASLTPQVAQMLSTLLNLPYETPADSLVSTRISHMDLLASMGVDAIGVGATTPTNHPTVTTSDGLITNEWGMVFKNAGLYNEFYSFPLANAETVADIEAYPFPDPFADGRFEMAKSTIQKYGKEYGIIADLVCSIFETAWYLVGLEKFFMDLMMETPYVEALLDKVAYINTETGKELIRLGDVFIYTDQRWMTISPDGYKTYFGKKNEPGPAKSDKDFQSNELHNGWKNLIDCVRSRKREDLDNDILEGHMSAALGHLGVISYRTGRKLIFNSGAEKFVNDPEADKLLTRNYRKPYGMPNPI